MNAAPSLSPGPLERRLLPAANPVFDDRRSAWDELLAAGIQQNLSRFVACHNYTSIPTEDIVQEVLLCAFLKAEHGKYQPTSPAGISAYLFTIAHYKIKEAARDHTHGSLDEIEELIPDARSERFGGEGFARRTVLAEALKGLPERRRKIVLLSVLYDYSSDEIARTMDIRADLVRKDKSLAMRQLRDSLSVDFPERIDRAA
ncbi:MAG: sigma-70 family RNA polymerase sigma factor [Anaerolineae bacterium]